MSTFVSAVRTAFLTVSALFLVSPSTGNALDLQAEIDPLAQQLLADEVAVGFVVGIYKDGEEQVIPYGETKKGKGAAPDGETIYEIGSVSKAFTGVLLADLVLRGRVKLNDPYQKYLPAAAKAELKNPTHITFQHLATQTSGLPRLPDNMRPADIANPYADYTFQQMFAFLKEHKLRRPPGEYEYSNLGVGLLGVLLARREKTSYEELMVARIAKPCGMDDTRITLSEQQRQRLAPPYDAALQPAKNWDLPAVAGAGAIRSTTRDMLKFIQANLAADDQPLTKAFRLSHEKRQAIPGGQGDRPGLAHRSRWRHPLAQRHVGRICGLGVGDSCSQVGRRGALQYRRRADHGARRENHADRRWRKSRVVADPAYREGRAGSAQVVPRRVCNHAAIRPDGDAGKRQIDGASHRPAEVPGLSRIGAEILLQGR